MADSYSFDKCPMDMNSGMTSSESCSSLSVSDINVPAISNSCCTSKTIDNKVKDNYLTSQNDNSNSLQLVAVINIAAVEGVVINSSNSSKIYVDPSPPPKYGNPLYITNSIFLI